MVSINASEIHPVVEENTDIEFGIRPSHVECGMMSQHSNFPWRQEDGHLLEHTIAVHGDARNLPYHVSLAGLVKGDRCFETTTALRTPRKVCVEAKHRWGRENLYIAHPASNAVPRACSEASGRGSDTGLNTVFVDQSRGVLYELRKGRMVSEELTTCHQLLVCATVLTYSEYCSSE
jgi:hypothetical protein